MRPKGTIYKKDFPQRGVVLITLPFHLRMVYKTLRGVGAGIIFFVVISFIFSLAPVLKEEIGYYFDLKGKRSESVSKTLDTAEVERVLEVQGEAEMWGVNSYFSVVIPKIKASSNVLANVDTTNKDEYLPALKKGVAHAKGTYFPGQGKRIFLFSHSTDSPLNFARYNAVFFLLRKLEKGDKVVVFFSDKKYEYQVVDKVVVSSKDTSWLSSETESEELILMTCDPPGTTWNRLLIIAKPLDNEKIGALK